MVWSQQGYTTLLLRVQLIGPWESCDYDSLVKINTIFSNATYRLWLSTFPLQMLEGMYKMFRKEFQVEKKINSVLAKKLANYLHIL